MITPSEIFASLRLLQNMATNGCEDQYCRLGLPRRRLSRRGCRCEANLTAMLRRLADTIEREHIFTTPRTERRRR